MFHLNPFFAKVVLPRNKIWYILFLKKNLQAFNSNSAKFYVRSQFNNEVIRFQTEQVSEKRLPLPTEHNFG